MTSVWSDSWADTWGDSWTPAAPQDAWGDSWGDAWGDSWGHSGVTPPPSAAFTGTPLAGQTPLAVQFTDQSTGDPTAWLWTATGQNTGTVYTSTAQNPLITFLVADVYNVTLRVTNDGGSDSLTKTGYVTATAPSGGDGTWNPPPASPSNWTAAAAGGNPWNPPPVGR